MQLVCSRLGDCVGNATRRTSILGRVTRSVNLKLANRGLANNIRNARAAALFSEEGLIVVAAIHGVVVQEARDAAKTDQAKSAIRNRTGRENSEVRPATPIDWGFIDRRLINVAGKILLSSIDYRCLGSYLNSSGYALKRQPNFQRRLASNLHHDILVRKR